jgi:hypothetical protein
MTWREYIKESRQTDAIFENAEGDRVAGSDPNRFDPAYADKQYAKLKDLERGLRAEYGKRLWTGMLSLTASSTDDDGRPRPPVDHLVDLDGAPDSWDVDTDGSWEAVRRELYRVMDGRRWEYLAILEPHKSGYLHIHIAVFVEGVVSPETFRPVVEAHLRNCDSAGRDAHDLDADDPDARPVSVKHVGSDRGENTIGNLGTYLAEYLHTYNGDPTDAPAHQQAANAVLWATGKQRWRPSQGAQEYMATNRSDDDSEWELVGIRDGEGEVYETDGDSGGVERIATCTDVRERDREPPPDREWYERDPGKGRRPRPADD